MGTVLETRVSEFLVISVIYPLLVQVTIPVSGDLIFEARESRLCSYQMEPDGNLGEASCFLENLSFTVGLEVDYEDRHLFFSDINEGTIRKVDIAEGVQQVEQIFHGLGSVEDIAVDWVAKNMYWTDFQFGHICVSRYDGSRRAILIDDQPGPRSIAIYPQKALLFWTNVGDTYTAGNIMISTLAGTDQRVIVGGGLSSPNGLAIDFDTNRVFFADRGTEMIESIKLGGGQRTQVYESPNADFFDMTILGGFLFTTRWSSDNPNGYITAVEYPEPNESAFVPTVIEIDEHSGKALGIATFDESRQPYHGKNNLGQCGDNNGGCSHLCLPTLVQEHDCACSTGFTLADDGLDCRTNITEHDFLLFIDSSLSTIFQGHLDDDDMQTVSALDLDVIKYPVDLAFDPVEGKVYWTDRSTKTVSRSRLDGSEYQIVAARNVEDPSGIDLDVLRRQVYWVDEDTKTINVINMDLTGQKVVVEGGLDEPRAITVNPLSGEIFWTDWGQQAKIEKANLDGSGRRAIILSDLAWPNGIAIDVEENQLFWCDAQHDLIETSDFDGNNRRVIAYLEDTAHPFGLAVDKSRIFWSDWTTRAVYSIDMDDGTEVPLAQGEDVFLRLQGMALSSVSYPLDATVTTDKPPATTEENNPGPGDNGALSSDSLVILIAAGVGGGLGLIALVIVATVIVCKCRNKSTPSSLEARAAENHAMNDLPSPYQPYPGKAAVNMPPQSKLKSEDSLKRPKGDHIYEDLDSFGGLSFDADEYLNPAFVKENNSQYTGLKMNRPSVGPAGGLDAYEAPSPNLTQKRQSDPAYYLDLNQRARNDSMGSYTDLRAKTPQHNPSPKTSVSSMSGNWPPQHAQSPYQTSPMPPKPPASPRPSQISMTSNWPPVGPSRSPRISATRPPPSPRFSQTGPQNAPRMSTTQRPPSAESAYFSSLGPPPSAPGGHYEVSMNMH